MQHIDPFSSALDLAEGLRLGRWSSQDLAELYLSRIERANGHLHAFVSVDRPGAIASAQASDARRRAGQTRGPLDGVPVAVKDLCEIEGQITTCGSQAWAQRRSPMTAAVVSRIVEAGMVILGKTHMTEFAFGLWGTNPLMGTPRNPWDPVCHRVPGGSSSGSAVAVAAGLAPIALGSDTGGSVRVPAALNGVTGLKTTAGLISLDGTLALAPTLDSIGPIGRSVADCLALTRIMTSRALDDPASGALSRPWRVAVMRESDFPAQVQEEVRLAYQAAIETFRQMDVELLDRAIPFDMDELSRLNAQLIAAQAWDIHGGYIDEEALAIGPHVRKRVQAGRAVTPAARDTALDMHRRHCQLWGDWMSDCDALLSPATPAVACPLAQVDEAVSPHAAFARAANYLGASALALPAGFSGQRLPIGVQLMAKANDEMLLASLGMEFQRRTNWHLCTPDTGPRDDEPALVS